MPSEVQNIIDQKLNLYEILELVPNFDDKEHHITMNDIKRQYKLLALKYHPDKQHNKITDASNIHRFHQILLAVSILSDEKCKIEYDSWLKHYIQQKRRDESMQDERKALLKDLAKKEALHSKDIISTSLSNKNIRSIQEYGESLRKIKQFKLPYGDWNNLNLTYIKKSNSSIDFKGDRKKDEEELNYDCCTLRLELDNRFAKDKRITISDEAELQLELNQKFGQEIIGIYYSSRNNYDNDDMVVAYIIFAKPSLALQALYSWRDSSFNSGLITNISPLIPPTYYSDLQLPDNCSKKLDPKIETLLAALDEVIVID